MAAAFPFTVRITGRLLFLSCFMKSPERRRKVVSDWISLVMSSIGLLLRKHLFRCYQNTTSMSPEKVSRKAARVRSGCRRALLELYVFSRRFGSGGAKRKL